MKYIFILSAFLFACAPAKNETPIAVSSCNQNPAPTFSSVGSIFSVHCDYCHGHNFQDYNTALSSSNNIYSQVSSGNMPQGTSLGASEKLAIEQWVSCGSKQ